MTPRTPDATSLATRRPLSAAAIAACLLIAPAVSACSFNPVESAIEQATGGNVDIGGTTVPDDFPGEVPLIDGEVTSAFAAGEPPERVWNVTFSVADASAREAIRAEMEAAGFTSDLDEAAIGDITGGMYSNGTYSVLIVVAEDGDGGWAASYTVASAAK
ncbi:MAG: hypothetical protein WED09_01265 [Homoserinimonas sp.]